MLYVVDALVNFHLFLPFSVTGQQLTLSIVATMRDSNLIFVLKYLLKASK